jgi:hypothetical protein
VRMADGMMERDYAQAHEVLATVQADVHSTLGELRDLREPGAVSATGRPGRPIIAVLPCRSYRARPCGVRNNNHAPDLRFRQGASDELFPSLDLREAGFGHRSRFGALERRAPIRGAGAIPART